MDLSNLLNNTTISKEKPNKDSNETNIKINIPNQGQNESRFNIPWNKLEKGMKLNRLLIFIKKEIDDKQLSKEQSKELKNILFQACETGNLNKLSDIDYDIEDATIKTIKTLDYNEVTKKYKLKSSSTKNRSVSKSRSNIDRLMNKKN